jgi:deazaflavin-dependent oxidoreductase (nitroreductase family)
VSSRSARYKPSLYPRERVYNPFIREQQLSLFGLSFNGGRVLSALELPWFSLLPPRGYGVLTTTGRKSGKQRRKCVRAIRRGDSVFIVSIAGARAGWLRNLETDPAVQLRLRGGRFVGRARELSGPLEAERAKQAYCETVSPVDYLACLNWRKGRPTHAKIIDLARGWFAEGIPLVVELTGA